MLTPLVEGRSVAMRTPILKRAATFSLFFAVVLTACGSRYGKPNQSAAQLAFGVDMARRGLWNEALFRFHQAETLDPRNPRVLNNLGVAYEATGDYDKALGYYKQALQVEPNNREVRANYGHFVEFYQSFKGKEGKNKGTGEGKPGAAAPGSPGQTPPAVPEATPPPAPVEPEATPPPPAEAPAEETEARPPV